MPTSSSEVAEPQARAVSKELLEVEGAEPGCFRKHPGRGIAQTVARHPAFAGIFTARPANASATASASKIFAM